MFEIKWKYKVKMTDEKSRKKYENLQLLHRTKIDRNWWDGHRLRSPSAIAKSTMFPYFVHH